MAEVRRNIGVPSGVVFPFAGTTAPYGYLICDGRAISRSEYPQLFAALGTSHGSGDGSTTFNLPDYRGRFLRGVDGVAGRDSEAGSRSAPATGGNSGNAVGSVQDSAVPNLKSPVAHVTGSNNAWAANSPIYWGSYQPNGVTYSGVAGNSQTSGLTLDASRVSPVYRDTATEVRPQNANVNYIIKT